MSRVLRFILATMFLFAVLSLVEGTLGVAHAQSPLTNGGKWVLTGSLHDARVGHTATLLENGQVLVAGGFGSTGILNTAELYTP